LSWGISAADSSALARVGAREGDAVGEPEAVADGETEAVADGETVAVGEADGDVVGSSLEVAVGSLVPRLALSGSSSRVIEHPDTTVASASVVAAAAARALRVRGRGMASAYGPGRPHTAGQGRVACPDIVASPVGA
jgi:hypothetical protein